MKSLDKTTNLKPNELLIHLLKLSKGLLENIKESHLQTGWLDVQHVQIFGVTPRTINPAPSSVGSKKEAGLEEISSRIAT